MNEVLEKASQQDVSEAADRLHTPGPAGNPEHEKLVKKILEQKSKYPDNTMH